MRATRRPPIARMLSGRSAATGRRIVRLFTVESDSAVWADRAVAWWARRHGVLHPVIYRHRSAWLIYPGARGRRWTRIMVPSAEQWEARRRVERGGRAGGRVVTHARSVAAARRDALLAWLRERPEHCGLTAREIADVSGIYSGNGRQERCAVDLRALERGGFVKTSRRIGGRWSLGEY